MITQAEAIILCRHDTIKAPPGALWRCSACGATFVPQSRLADAWAERDKQMQRAERAELALSQAVASMKKQAEDASKREELQLQCAKDDESTVLDLKVHMMAVKQRLWLEMAASGMNRVQIAERLGISIDSVAHLRERALKSLEVGSTQEAIALAYKAGLV